MYVFLQRSAAKHFTCGLHPSLVDAPVDIHDPSCNFPYFHPWEAFLVGCQVTTLPFCSCDVISSSPPKEVILQGWDWYTCPVHDSYPYTREHQPLMQQKKLVLVGGLVTVCVGSSLHRRACQLQFVVIPPKSLHPTYPYLPLSLPGIHLH